MDIKNIKENEFEKEVLKSDKPVLVDFFAKWCGPCMMLSPIIEEVAKDYENSIKVCKVNIDNELELAKKYKIYSIPNLVIFKNGEIASQSVGYQSREELINFINSNKSK